MYKNSVKTGGKRTGGRGDWGIETEKQGRMTEGGEEDGKDGVTACTFFNSCNW